MNSSLLITDSLTNRTELLSLLQFFEENKPIADFVDELRTSETNTLLAASITAVSDPSWTDEKKIRAIIASRYLASVGKGENALELANALEANLNFPDVRPTNIPAGTPVQLRIEFHVPAYIRESIDWICQ